MNIRVFYVSSAVGPQTTYVTESILRWSQDYNSKNGITGFLCQGQGVFLQVLEGERHEVVSLYTRIFADKRHKNVEMIHFENIAQRRYERWSMAHVNLSEVDPMMTINWAEFDPYSVKGRQVMAKIDQLISQSNVIGLPAQ